MFEGFNPLTADQFLEIGENGGDHPLFAWMALHAQTNDVFFDGLNDGYVNYYNVRNPRPEFHAEGLYLFLKGVMMQDCLDGVQGAAFLDAYKMGYVAGWMLALGENKQELFYIGRDHQFAAGVSGYSRLCDQYHLEILGREELPARHMVQYVLKDGNGLYIAEVDAQGVVCTCSCSGVTPECGHVHFVERISPWFDDTKVIGKSAEVASI